MGLKSLLMKSLKSKPKEPEVYTIADLINRLKSMLHNYVMDCNPKMGLCTDTMEFTNYLLDVFMECVIADEINLTKNLGIVSQDEYRHLALEGNIKTIITDRVGGSIKTIEKFTDRMCNVILDFESTTGYNMTGNLDLNYEFSDIFKESKLLQPDPVTEYILDGVGERGSTTASSTLYNRLLWCIVSWFTKTAKDRKIRAFLGWDASVLIHNIITDILYLESTEAIHNDQWYLTKSDYYSEKIVGIVKRHLKYIANIPSEDGIYMLHTGITTLLHGWRCNMNYDEGSILPLSAIPSIEKAYRFRVMAKYIY